MAKKVAKEPGTLILTWRPADLPTIQHRAGLGGLAVALDCMRNTRVPNTPEIRIAEDGSVTLELTKAGLQALYDYVYRGTLIEAQVDTIRKRGKGTGKKEIPPLKTVTIEEEDQDGKTKAKKKHIYLDVFPDAPFLQALGCTDPWLKLWRDALWGTTRGVPNTRLCYVNRAPGIDDEPRSTPSDFQQTWKELCAPAAKQKAQALSSALCIGAQAKHGDEVPFGDESANAFLLEFWPVAMRIYIPEKLDRKAKRTFDGYLLAIPDVWHPAWFVADFKEACANLTTHMNGYRPRDAVITVPGEGGLEYLRELCGLAQTKADRERPESVTAVDVFHLQKVGNTVPLRSLVRVPLDICMLQDYELVREKFHHVLFRRQLINNILRRHPWYRSFGELFTVFPHEFFIGARAASFVRNASIKFHQSQSNIGGTNMGSNEDQVELLATRIQKLVQNYAWRRAEEKSRCKYEEFKNKKRKDESGNERMDVPKEYVEALEKVCKDAFLRFRSCRSREDFLTYFTGTICSVPQFVKADEFIELTRLLLDDEKWEDARAIAMLACSSTSRIA